MSEPTPQSLPDITETCLGNDFTQTLTGDEGHEETNAAAPHIEGYRLKNKIGQGAFGSVWQAVREPSGLEVAIKVLHKGGSGIRFRTEFGRLRDLSDDHFVLGVIDASFDSTPPYIVTPFCPNGSLDSRCRLGKDTATFDDRVLWFEQLVEALGDAHKRGFLHCDLKPSNVLLDSKHQVLLADFGQSSEIDEDTVNLGTLGYMPPEQALSLEQGIRPQVAWDVYALGATAYALFAGSAPRLQSNHFKVLQNTGGVQEKLAEYARLLSECPLIPLNVINREVDDELMAIIEGCLKLDPGQRTESVAEVLADLGRRRRGEPLVCRKPWSATYRARKAWRLPAVRVGLALGLLLVFSIVAYIYGLKEKNRQLLLRRGVEAMNSERSREAFLLWAKALTMEPSDTVLRRRLNDYPHQLITLIQTEGAVTAVSLDSDFSSRASTEADGVTLPEFLATGTSRGDVAVWQAKSGQQKWQKNLGSAVRKVGFVPEHVWALSTDRLLVWEMSTGNEIANYSVVNGEPVISADGSWIAIPVQGGYKILGLTKPAPDVLADKLFEKIEFGPYGRWMLAHASENATLFDLLDGKRFIVEGDALSVYSLHVSELFGPEVIQADQSGQVTRWTLDEEQLVGDTEVNGRRTGIQRIEGNPWELDLYAVAYYIGESLAVEVRGLQKRIMGPRMYLDDGGTALTGGGKRLRDLRFLTQTKLLLEREEPQEDRESLKALELWDLKTGRTFVLPSQSAPTIALDVNQQGFVLTGATDGTARLWRTNQEDDVAELGGGIDRIAFLPAGRLVHSNTGGDLDAFPKGWPSPSFDHEKRLMGLIYLDGSLATASRDRTAAVLDAKSGSLNWKSPLHQGEVTALDFDGSLLATGTEDGKIQVWQPPLEKPIFEANVESKILALALTQDQLMVGQENGEVHRYEISSGRRLEEWRQDDPVTSILTLSGNPIALVAGRSAFLHSPQQEKVLEHFGRIDTLIVDSGVRRLATASEDGTARVWDYPSGEPVTAPLRHDKPVVALAFSDDGLWLASGDQEGRVVVWETETGRQASRFWQCDGRIQGLRFELGGLRYVTEEGKTDLLPLKGTNEAPKQILDRLEAFTGARLDETGSLLPLNQDEIQKRLEKLP
jgi:WD40 repeat protein